MNKFIKYLIETVDDDFFSDLGYDTTKEVTFLVDDSIYPENILIIGTTISYRDIENIEHIGSILSKDNDIWLLWNLDNEYWDPFSEINSIIPNTFGEIIGICVGKGMFAKVDWTGLNRKYSWTVHCDDIYYTLHKININGSGYDSTMNIINNFKNCISGTIWEHLVNESTNEYLLYLPNKEELKTIYNNVGKSFSYSNIHNLLKINNDKPYWSSSQNPKSYDGYKYILGVNFYSGYFFNMDKVSYSYYSIVLLHF